MFHVSTVYATSNIVRRSDTHVRRLYIRIVVTSSAPYDILQQSMFFTHHSNIKMDLDP